jgi:hypothetical protein
MPILQPRATRQVDYARRSYALMDPTPERV